MSKKTKDAAITMAKSISAAVCDCGNLYIRLHNASGDTFAAGCMGRDTGLRLVDEIVRQLRSPSVRCEAVH